MTDASWPTLGTCRNAGFVAGVLVVCASPVAGQCSDCRIEVTAVTTFGRNEGDPGFLGFPYSVARDARGRYIVAVPFRPRTEPPFVFDASGAFVRRIGRAGSGPNEYQQPIKIIVGRGDSIVIVDQRLARVTILPPDLALARSFTAGEYRDGVQLAGGDFIVQSELGASLFLRVSPMGARVTAWPDTIRECSGMSGCWSRRARVLFASADSGFWSARRNHHYELEYRDKAGTLRRTLRPRSPWFATYDSSANPKPGVAPQASLVGMWQDTEGRLWIVGNTADQEWRRAEWETKTVEGVRVASATDTDALVDGVIEVLDARTGASLAAQRVPQRLDGVAAPGFIYSARQDSDGFWQVTVSNVRLTRARR